MKSFKLYIVIAALVAALFGTGYAGFQQYQAAQSAISKMDAQKARDAEDVELGQYTLNLMYSSPDTVKSLSPAVMASMTRNIVHDVRDVMDDDFVQKQMFISAVEFESKFLKFAQSPTGPKGLSQTTKGTFHAALRYCGLNDVKDNDVWDTDMSIYAGACYFKWLYNSYYNGYFVDLKGKPTNRQICPDNEKEPSFKKICAGQKATVAYNQGENSQAIKDFLRSGVLSEKEPAIYNGKVVSGLVSTPTTPLPGVPNVSDLPKPKGPMKANESDSAKK